MLTTPMRVPDRVHKEVLVAARVTGRGAAEIIEEAWTHFKSSPEFEVELREAQKAFAADDIAKITDLAISHAARSKAQSIRQSRDDES